MQIHSVGIDLGKTTFHLVALNAVGTVLLWSEWKELEQQIVAMNGEVEQIASSDPVCQRLRQIPGIGPLIATAIVAAISNGAAFHNGREFAAWLGLVPRQHSTSESCRPAQLKQLPPAGPFVLNRDSN